MTDPAKPRESSLSFNWIPVNAGIWISVTMQAKRLGWLRRTERIRHRRRRRSDNASCRQRKRLGHTDQVRQRNGIHFAHSRRPVDLNCDLAQAQFPRDLLVAITPCNQSHDLSLARRQQLVFVTETLRLCVD